MSETYVQILFPLIVALCVLLCGGITLLFIAQEIFNLVRAVRRRRK